MKKLSLLLISLFATASAFAAPFSFGRFYVDGFGGLNVINTEEKNSVEVNTHPGFAVGGTLGYRFTKYIRLEGEGAFRMNKYNNISFQGIDIPLSGSLKKTTLMGNAIVEIPIIDSCFIPYFGGGVGERWDRESINIDSIVLGSTDFEFKNDSGIAYQGIAGLTFWRGRKLQAAAEYRYLDGPHFQGNHTLNLKVKRYF